MERLQAHSRSSGFVIVYEVMLSKSFGDIADLVMDDGTSIAMLTFADKFTFERTLTMRYIGARDKDKDIEVG